MRPPWAEIISFAAVTSMAIRINQNLISLLIQKNLGKTTSRMETTFDRLSSGERIRRASDDPSGLSISQQMRFEIRGLQRNQQNVGGALSMVGVAEGGMEGVQQALQRARELLVQAANETLGPDNRNAIEEEIKQILSEIQRSASTTDYLGRNLLDGTFVSQNIQVGTSTGQSLSLSLRDFQTNALGMIARAVGQNQVGNGPIVGGGDLQINGVDIPQSLADGISYIDPVTDLSDESAIAKARAINSVTAQTGVSASVEPTEHVVPGAGISSITINGSTNSLLINGISIGPMIVLGGDSNGDLVRSINDATATTGVVANIEPGGELRLLAKDGRNITVETTGSVADELGLAVANGDVDVTSFGKLSLQSDTPFTVGGTLALIGFDAGQATVNLDATTAIQNISALSAVDAGKSLEFVDAAMRQLGISRANLGALQNRLDGMGEDLARRIEELSASDSRIRDADFALESTRLVQSQILQDAAISLLSQANVAPRAALRLLQN